MAQPHPQAGHSHSPGAAGQPQVAQRQTPIGEKTLNPQPQLQRVMEAPRTVPAPSLATAPPGPQPRGDDARADSDWGLAPSKPGLSRENKFILFVLFVLVAVFSFVVFRNFQKKQNAKAGEQVAAKDTASDKQTAQKSTSADGKHQPSASTELNAEESDTVALSESPADDDPFTQSASDSVPHQPGKSNGSNSALAADDAEETAEELAEESTSAVVASDDAPPQLSNTSETEDANTAIEMFEGSDTGSQAVVTATPVAHRGRRGNPSPGRRSHSQEEFVAPVQGETAEGDATAFEQSTQELPPAQEMPADELASNAHPADQMPADADSVEFVDDLTQVGGESVAQPIRQKAPAAPAGMIESSQQVTSGEFIHPPADIGQTVPRNMPPRTAPRAATQPRGTQPRATQPRATTNTLPPPPLDAEDPRLGGYREGELIPSNPTPHVAGRGPVATPVGQFDPHSEPLIANGGEYVVRPNDNYWRISRKVYGTARYFAALARHNESIVPNPKNMRPGIKISTPPREQLDMHYGELVPLAAPTRPVGAVINPPHAPKTPGYFVEPDGQPAYRIGATDTLSSISQKTLGRSSRWDEIYEMNRDRLAGADSLTVGAILRLPQDASQTRVVGRPVENR